MMKKNPSGAKQEEEGGDTAAATDQTFDTFFTSVHPITHTSHQPHNSV